MTDDLISAAKILPDVQSIRERVDVLPLHAESFAQWQEIRGMLYRMETYLRWIRDEARRIEEGDRFSDQLPLCLGAGKPRLRDENDDQR